MFNKKYLLLPLLVLLALTFGVFFFSNGNQKNNPKTVAEANGISVVNAVSPISSNSMMSPDGKETLTLKKETNQSMTTFSFFTNEGMIFTKTASSNVLFSVPFNTWSPDDKSVFIKEDTGSVVNYYVFPGGINVTDLFNEKITSYKLADATGWASPTLLILNTNNLDGSQGPSYWFDIPSKSFIILSTRFN